MLDFQAHLLLQVGRLNLFGSSNPVASMTPKWIQYGTLAGFTDDQSILWGTSITDVDGQSILWGTSDEESILWGTTTSSNAR